MSDPASSAVKAPLSKHQAFWRAKRKCRTERLPHTMAISAGMFCVVALIQASFGVFDGWKPAEATGRQLSSSSPVTRTDQLEAWQQLVPSQGRQLSVAQFNLTAIAILDSMCPQPPNSSSLLPPIGLVNDEGADTTDANKAGATIYMIFWLFYMFLGLAIICDCYFEAALSAICDNLQLKDDVAGATFMAAGGSAPELSTSIIGVFISVSDVGVGTIVGSAVFNVLFVIGCCSFVADNLTLTWWPLARDCSYYCLSLAMIVIFISDDFQIHVWEASFLLLMYGGYVTIMYFNERLEVWVKGRIEQNMKPGNGFQEGLKKVIDHPAFFVALNATILANAVVVIMEIMEFNTAAAQLPCICGINVGAGTIPQTWLATVNLAFNIFFIVEMVVKMYAYGFFGYWKIPLNCFDGSLVFIIVIELVLTESARAQALAQANDPLADSNDAIGAGVARLLRLLKFVRFFRMARILRLLKIGAKGDATATVTPEADAEAPKEVKEGKEEGGEAEEEEEDDDDDGPYNPFEPWGDLTSPGGLFGRTMWLVGLPLAVGMWLTIPDCRREMFAKFWFITFTNGVIWIGLLATVMGWMSERLGLIYHVPPSIMGLFVLAAGTSIPDMLSSVAVARRGHGDMAVSSSIGSNIFDVLLGLPIPWFVYTAILRPAGVMKGPQWVQVESEALAVMILLLFVMVALVVTSVHLSGWLLSKKLGLFMMFGYFCFLVIALLLDQKFIFPDCEIIDPAIGGR